MKPCPTPPLIIALTGKPGAGKDTIANVLVPQQGFTYIAFADALRREVSDAWHIDVRMLTYRPTKEVSVPALAVGMCHDSAFIHWCASACESLVAPRSPRWVLQQWASFKRRYTPDYYARIVARWINRQISCGWNRIVVTDLRDPIEEATLRSMGAKVIRVHRPDLPALPENTAMHVSEQHHRIKVDADILNDGSLLALADATLECIGMLEQKHNQFATEDILPPTRAKTRQIPRKEGTP